MPTKFSRTAKLAFALEIAGLDPTAFPDGAGTRDLLAELRSVLNPDGSFGSSDDPFLHAFVLLALSRTSAGVPTTAVEWLRSRQCQESPAVGAFGYKDCSTADPDYTALAVDGLLAAGVPASDPAVTDALGWLSQQQAADGGVAGNTNSTGLVGQAFAAADTAGPAGKAGDYVGGLQLSCAAVLSSNGALVDDNVGAIAWTPGSLRDAVESGIDDGTLGQWQYASVQAVFALGAPPLGRLTSAGVDPALPAAAVCAVPTSSAPTSSAPTSGEPAPTGSSTAVTSYHSASTVLLTSSSTGLAATGVTSETAPTLGWAFLLIVAGLSVLVLARPRLGGRHR